MPTGRACGDLTATAPRIDGAYGAAMKIHTLSSDSRCSDPLAWCRSSREAARSRFRGGMAAIRWARTSGDCHLRPALVAVEESELASIAASELSGADDRQLGEQNLRHGNGRLRRQCPRNAVLISRDEGMRGSAPGDCGLSTLGPAAGQTPSERRRGEGGSPSAGWRGSENRARSCASDGSLSA